jgi:glycosyltransferase involved in cell wall biosynthesis
MNPFAEPTPAPSVSRDETAEIDEELTTTQSLTSLVVIGASPPPVHGVVIMTGQLLGALRKLDACAGHLDIRDPRPIATLGRLDLRNVTLGLRHAWQLDRMLARSRDAAGVHISVSQVKWGFVRDAVFAGVVRLRRRRLYIQLHGGALAEFHRQSSLPMRLLIRAVLRQAYQVWVLTPTLRAQFDGLASADRVHCIPNVVDDPLAGVPSASSHEIGDPAVLRVLHLSNLLPEKGCFDLLAALRLLGPESADWEIRIVGSAAPDTERRLRQEIADLEEQGAARVSLLGELTGHKKSEQYRWANVFAFPATGQEGQPLVLLEALGAGLPVVATSQTGIGDTVADGQEGLLIEPGDTRALAVALVRLSREPNFRKQLGAGARMRYESLYQPSRLVSDLAAVLKL